MKRFRHLMPFLGILLIIPLALPVLGLGAVLAPVPVQVQLSGPASSQVAAQSGDPQRIQFPPGGTSATVQGSVAPNATDQYVLQASAGQTLTVQVTTTIGQIVVTITGADGTLLVTDYVGNSTFSGVVPTTQDYTISVQASGQTTAQYALGISIPAASTTPSAGALRIQFASGATSASVQGNLPANGSQQYLVRVAAGQLMQVDVTPQQNMQMSVKGVDGTVLKSGSGVAFFRGDVPSSQDYVITLTGGNAATNYTLTVTIPVRISFAAGATSATVPGNLAANTTGNYVVKAQAGQTMTIDTTTTQGQIVVIVYGADGAVLQSDHAGAAGFSGTLPTTQDYLIDIRSVGQAAALFSMTVTIPPLSSGGTPPSGAQRIQFAAGATSAVVQGSLPISSIAHYVIRAEAGQTMTIQTSTTQGQVIVIVYGADGNVLQSDHATSPTFSGSLPTTQDYFIDVESGPNSAAQYSMTVTIPPSGSGTKPSPGARRILFASGATSATEQGTLPAGGSQQYYVKVNAGQILIVDVGSGQSVQMSVRGVNGTVLQSKSANDFFRGVVPTSQDYIVTLTGGNAAIPYSIRVTVPERISFAAGATSATVKGDLPPNTIGHYVLGASAGQTMTIKTMTTQGQIVLVVYGADGTVLISDHAGATSFTGTLPSSQDYFIEVVSVGQAAASFSMTINIPPSY
jgi:hypothetical protein